MIYTSPYGEIPDLPKGNALINYFESPYRHEAPDKRAFIDAATDEVLTASQCESASYKFATYLQDVYKIEKGDVIVLSVLNTPFMQPIHFGALTLGATISPANIMYSASDLAHQFSLVKPKLVVYNQNSRDIVPEALQLANHDATTVSISELESRIRGLIKSSDYPQTKPVWVDGPTHPAYYCFSSGTSGLPKCVVTTHQNMISVTHQTVKAQPRMMTDVDITAAILPMSHIYGLTTFVWTLPYFNKTVVVYPRFEFESLLKGIVKYKIKALNVVPPIVLLFAKSPLVDKYPQVKDILSIIKSGAAPISRSTVELLMKRFPNVEEVVNGYGMTEMSPASHLKGADPEKLYQLGSVGWVCPSTEMRLVDPETLKDVKPGEPGEIWIRGPQVMKEYLHNKKATDEMITPDRWLRTGDVGRVDETQQVYIVDRIKELIKSKGHQVAPAELEGVMLKHPLVNDCAVVGVSDADGVTELPRAYVATTEQADLNEIINWFNDQVSRHKRLWGGIVKIEAVPKNNSGKILRRILKERRQDEVIYAVSPKL